MPAPVAYTGRMLRVDLSTGHISRERLAPDLLRMYVGGIGVGARILYDEVPPEIMPFDPANRLILASGPFGGTRVPGSGTFTAVTKGPLTNLMAAAQANGFFGARMRFAGFEVIVLQGAAKEWQYLWIHDGEVELRPAGHLLGLDVWTTEDSVKDEVGQRKASVACIGPAGENLVRFAGICTDRGHIASSNGPGAVMGSKKLKAIAVFGNSARVETADHDRVESLARGELLETAEQSALGRMVSTLGTLGHFSGMLLTGGVTVKNLTTNVFPEGEKFDGAYIRAHFPRKPRPCWACPWGHCGLVKVTEGPEAGYEGEEPEFEEISAWGPLVGITDPGTAIKLANLNTRLGLDVKECSFAISLAIECCEKGVLDAKETGLRWGNAEAIASLIEDIAQRRGLGGILAEGVRVAAGRIGGAAPSFAVYVKRGIAPHVLDPRGRWSFMLNQSLSDSGSFNSSANPNPDIGIERPVGPHAVDDLPPALAKGAPLRQLQDALGTCQFLLTGRLSSITAAVSAVTGWDFTVEEALTVGHRITTLMRAFNIRHGMSIDDDVVSPRLAEAPRDGPAVGMAVGPVHEQMAQAYYRAMGWDDVSSKPLPNTLIRLGMGDLVGHLWG